MAPPSPAGLPKVHGGRPFTIDPARPRADGARPATPTNTPTNPVEAFSQLNEAFAAFREAHNTQMAELRAGLEDVVTTETVDRINASVGVFQDQLDAMNARIESANLNAENDDQPRDPEYVRQFETWFRGGDDGARASLRSMIAQGPRAEITDGSAAEGGVLTPIEWDRTVINELRASVVMRQLCRTITIGGLGFTRLVKVGSFAAQWLDNNEARTETGTPTFVPLEWQVHHLEAEPHATRQILEDNEIDLETWIAGEVAEEFALAEETAFIAGDGSKKPHGVLTYVTGGSADARHPIGAIGVKAAAATTAFTVDELVDLIGLLPEQHDVNSTMIANRTTMFQIRKLKDADGDLIWRPGLESGNPATILGRPARTVSAMPNAAAGTSPILFGDFMRGYQIVDRRGIFVLRDPYTAKPFIKFSTSKRVGGGVNDPRCLKALQMAAS